MATARIQYWWYRAHGWDTRPREVFPCARRYPTIRFSRRARRPPLPIQTQRIEAECAFSATSGNCKGTLGGQQGTKLENGDADVGYIEGGDYLYYESIALTGITTLQLHYAKGVDGGTVEVRLDSVTGPSSERSFLFLRAPGVLG